MEALFVKVFIRFVGRSVLLLSTFDEGDCLHGDSFRIRAFCGGDGGTFKWQYIKLNDYDLVIIKILALYI